MKMQFCIPLIVLAMLLLSGEALGTTYTAEDFNYGPGTAITATGNWSAHSGGGTNPILVTSSGLSYPGYPAGTGNAASMTTSGEDDHTTAAFTHSSGTIYFAFLANFSAAQATGDYFAHFYQSSTSFYGRVFAKLVSGSVNFGVTRGAGTANYSTTPFDLNATHLVVIKYDLIAGTNNDTVDLFVDPIIGPVEPAPLVSATDVASTDATSIVGVALRQGSAANAATQWVDGIRVATTWDEAVGSVAAYGACCFVGGTCLVLTATECSAQGGTYQGDNTSCTPNPCLAQGACCFADGSCQVLTQANCTAQTGVYQGDGTTCDPNPCPIPQPTDRTLCEISQDAANGRPLYEGEWVRIHGICTLESNTWAGNRIEFTITDGECCTNVYNGSTSTPIINVGDEVEVVGTVGFFNGKTQVTTPNLTITVQSTGNPIGDPGLVTSGDLALNGENFESCLIKIRCVSIISGTWPAAGADATIQVDDGTGICDLRIDKDTNVDGSPAPTGPFTIIGIASQYDSSDPYSSGYQIMPRWIEDILYDDCAPQTGACCFPNGICTVLTRDECVAQSGIYAGDGTTCTPNPCSQPEACCFPDGNCQVLLADICSNQGGTPQGPGTVCGERITCPQPPQACCFADGSCQIVTPEECAVLGGQAMGNGTVCDPNPCAQPPVACCFPDGHCEFLTADICTQMGGAPQGFGTVCDPNPCPQPSMACCFTDGHCEFVTAERCTALGGAPQGFGTVCEPNPCPQPPPTGACCLDDQGHCEILIEADCVQQNGQYQGDGTLCDPNPCPIVPTRNTSWGQIKANYR